MMNNVTKSEFYHLLVGLIAVTLWAFGDKWGLPKDVITYAGITTVSVVSYVIGKTTPSQAPAVLPAPSMQPAPDIPALEEAGPNAPK